jgi:hypothetical protein
MVCNAKLQLLIRQKSSIKVHSSWLRSRAAAVAGIVALRLGAITA